MPPRKKKNVEKNNARMVPEVRDVQVKQERSPTPNRSKRDTSSTLVKQEAKDTPPEQWPTPSLYDQDLRMSYNIARGEQGVLTFEPYKGILLPHWRFRTVPIAEESSTILWNAFQFYVKAGDFVGADMARKFIQMGMTRAKRYANHAGGRKYDRTEKQVEAEGSKRTELPKSTGHKGREEKLAASEVFREVWKRCTADDAYATLREEWKAEKKGWEKSGGGKANAKVKKEEKDEVGVKQGDSD